MAGENSSPILSSLWTKVHDILRQYTRPFVLSDVLARWYVTFRSEDIRHQVSKSSKNRINVKVFGPIFSGGTTPSFLQQIVSAIYRPPFDKVWLSSVC